MAKRRDLFPRTQREYDEQFGKTMTYDEFRRGVEDMDRRQEESDKQGRKEKQRSEKKQAEGFDRLKRFEETHNNRSYARRGMDDGRVSISAKDQKQWEKIQKKRRKEREKAERLAEKEKKEAWKEAEKESTRVAREPERTERDETREQKESFSRDEIIVTKTVPSKEEQEVEAMLLELEDLEPTLAAQARRQYNNRDELDEQYRWTKKDIKAALKDARKDKEAEMKTGRPAAGTCDKQYDSQTGTGSVYKALDCRAARNTALELEEEKATKFKKGKKEPFFDKDAIASFPIGKLKQELYKTRYLLSAHEKEELSRLEIQNLQAQSDKAYPDPRQDSWERQKSERDYDAKAAAWELDEAHRYQEEGEEYIEALKKALRKTLTQQYQDAGYEKSDARAIAEEEIAEAEHKAQGDINSRTYSGGFVRASYDPSDATLGELSPTQVASASFGSRNITV